jgi:hypothetical protein
MKSFIVCALVCVLGCGASPQSAQESTGLTRPDPNPGNPPVWEDPYYEDPCNVGGQYVTIWVDGQPVPQWQPVICDQGVDPNTGDPAPFEGDPDPNKLNQKLQQQSR